MIRFIDLDDQISLDVEAPAFAFYDTTTDQFVKLDGTQAWETIERFIECFDLAREDRKRLDRYLGLIPSRWKIRGK